MDKISRKMGRLEELVSATDSWYDRDWRDFLDALECIIEQEAHKYVLKLIKMEKTERRGVALLQTYSFAWDEVVKFLFPEMEKRLLKMLGSEDAIKPKIREDYSLPPEP
jgi:hypothetical protein